jgi:ATP/ADP translocase
MNILDIEKDERGKTLIFSLMLGIRTFGYTLGWSAVQTILLKRLGIDSLPYSFILFAIIGMIGTFFYLFFADVISRQKLLKIFCSATGIIIIISGFFIPEGNSNGLIISCCLILAGNGIGYSTTGIQIWTLINDTFTPAQGTRIYPIIATAPLIGSIAGGTVLPVLVDTLGMKSLIIIWGITVIAVLPLLEILQKYYGEEIISKTAYLDKISRNFLLNLKEGFSFSLTSPLVRVLGLICILFWTVASLKEFQYGRIMIKAFPTEVELSKYYAYFNIYLHITVLIFQLLFTGKLIKLTGVSRGFAILPVTILSGLILVLISFSFYSGLIMRFTWDLVAMTVQGSIFQLSFNGISAPYRGRIRGFLEGFINPLGGILGGAIIIIINRCLYNTSAHFSHMMAITLIAIVFSLIWIFVSLITKNYYRKAIIENLNSDDRRTCLDSIEMLVELEKSVAIEKSRQFLKVEDEEVKRTLAKTMKLVTDKS